MFSFMVVWFHGSTLVDLFHFMMQDNIAGSCLEGSVLVCTVCTVYTVAR